MMLSDKKESSENRSYNSEPLLEALKKKNSTDTKKPLEKKEDNK